MNMASKGKKKMVLPTRPDLPSVDQIIEDINRAESNDPVFKFLQIPNEGDALLKSKAQVPNCDPGEPPVLLI